MPNFEKLLKEHTFCPSPDGHQVSALAAADPEFSYLPPADQTKILDFKRVRFGAPRPHNPQPLGDVKDLLSHLVVNLPQNLALGRLRGLADFAPTGADLTGLIHKPFNTELGDKGRSKLQKIATDLRSKGALLDRAQERAGSLPALISL
jgi:hypothetical protein